MVELTPDIEKPSPILSRESLYRWERELVTKIRSKAAGHDVRTSKTALLLQLWHAEEAVKAVRASLPLALAYQGPDGLNREDCARWDMFCKQLDAAKARDTALTRATAASEQLGQPQFSESLDEYVCERRRTAMASAYTFMVWCSAVGSVSCRRWTPAAVSRAPGGER